MKYQKVNMLIQFKVPVGKEYYGFRNTDAPWKRYAIHDMRQYIKDAEDIPEQYRNTVTYLDHSFDWLDEYEQDN